MEKGKSAVEVVNFGGVLKFVILLIDGAIVKVKGEQAIDNAVDKVDDAKDKAADALKGVGKKFKLCK